MIGVVLDTNVYVSGLVFGGLSRTILQLAERQAFQLAVSGPIQKELNRVLVEKFNWSDKQVISVCQPLWDIAQFVSPISSVDASDDPDDNRILECALEAQAQAIVTGDNHLLHLKRFQDIPIITPRQFLETGTWKRG